MRPLALACLLVFAFAADAKAARTVVRIVDDTIVYVRPGGPILRAGGMMQALRGSTWVVRRHGSWLGVTTSLRRDGKLGWIRKSARMTLTTTRLLAQVDLSARRVRVTRGARRLFSAPVSVGATRSSSPTGLTSVAARIPVTTVSGLSRRAYGPMIIALRLWQPLASPGLPRGGKMAFHGSARPAIGTASTGGCFRLRDDALRRLARLLVPGTPVIIHR